MTALGVILALGVAAPAASAQQSGQIGKLSAAWWQQVVQESSPPTCGSLDATPGNVFYLANFAGQVDATCTAPTGSRILFPIINWACSPQLSDPYTTERDLRDLCSSLLNYSWENAEGVYATVDGKDVTNRIVCAESPLFSLTVPQDSFLVGPEGPGVPGTGPAIANGCWVLLAPLPPGEHTITLGGTFPLLPEIFGEGAFFTQEATYTVTVVPGRRN